MTLRNLVLPFILFVTLLSTTSTWAEGTDWAEEQILLPGTGDDGTAFGAPARIDGDTVLVCSSKDDDNDLNTGSAYIFVRSDMSWTQQEKLLPDNGVGYTGYDFFGSSGDIDGNTIVVGASGDDDAGLNAGAAYVFVRSGTSWTQQDKILPPSTDDSTGFGSSVSLDVDTVVIGARDTAVGDFYRVLYVYVSNGTTWNKQAKLVSPAGADSVMFGSSISLDGDTLIIGEESNLATYTGAVYVFEKSNGIWSLAATLASGDVGDYFGHAVSLEGETAIVGAYYSNTWLGTLAGAAYVFTRSGTTWTQQAQLLSPLGGEEDYFGVSVSLDGDNAIVSSLGNPEVESHAGKIHFFRRSGADWSHVGQAMAVDGDALNHYTSTVAIDGSTALATAYFLVEDDEEPGAFHDTGRVHVFSSDGLPDSESCADDSECESGFCVDDVCCDSECGGGALDDCLACSVAKGAAQEGVCDELDGTACDDGDDDTFDDTCHQGDCFGDSTDDSDTDSASDPDADASVIVPPVETRCSCETVGGDDRPALVRALVSLLL